jgi:hypothetical protein
MPIIDPSLRTVCACAGCTVFCGHMPGYLSPDDLEPLAAAIAPRALEDVLLASPGAVVAFRGQQYNIPTIVPARRRGGCVFFTAERRCGIHAVAPFGCAYFDDHMPKEEGDRRSSLALRAILVDKMEDGPYARLHHRLVAMGRTARRPAVARAAIAAAERQGLRRG